MTFVVGRAPLVVTRPHVAAADCSGDALFAPKSALKRAIAGSTTLSCKSDQLRALVERLEAEPRAAP